MSNKQLSEQQYKIIASVWISPAGLDSPERCSCEIFGEMSFMKGCGIQREWPRFSSNLCGKMVPRAPCLSVATSPICMSINSMSACCVIYGNSDDVLICGNVLQI